MFTKISLALAGLLTVATATLPAHLVISVVEISTGTTIGSLNGYGNFSSPGPDYPFAAYASTGNDSTLSGYGTCTVDSILACYQTTGTAAEFFDLDGEVALDGTDGTWSVAATTDAAGGTNPFGLKYGIPVYIGSTAAAVPVTLQYKSTSG